MRVTAWGRISPLRSRGSTKRPLISLDEALRPARRLEAATDLRRLVRGIERTSKRSVIHTLLTQIDALHDDRLRAEHAWVFALQRPIRGLRVRLAPLRGDLNEIAAARPAGARGAWGGLYRVRVGRCHPNRRLRRGRTLCLRRERQRRIGICGTWIACRRPGACCRP